MGGLLDAKALGSRPGDRSGLRDGAPTRSHGPGRSPARPSTGWETCLNAVQFEASRETGQIRPVGLPAATSGSRWTTEGDEDETFVLVVAVRTPSAGPLTAADLDTRLSTPESAPRKPALTWRMLGHRRGLRHRGASPARLRRYPGWTVPDVSGALPRPRTLTLGGGAVAAAALMCENQRPCGEQAAKRRVRRFVRALRGGGVYGGRELLLAALKTSRLRWRDRAIRARDESTAVTGPRAAARGAEDVRLSGRESRRRSADRRSSPARARRPGARAARRGRAVVRVDERQDRMGRGALAQPPVARGRFTFRRRVRVWLPRAAGHCRLAVEAGAPESLY